MILKLRLPYKHNYHERLKIRRKNVMFLIYSMEIIARQLFINYLLLIIYYAIIFISVFFLRMIAAWTWTIVAFQNHHLVAPSPIPSADLQPPPVAR